MDKPSKNLALQIEKRLSALNRKAAWLAKEAEVNASGLGRILKGEGNPGLDVIAKLATALECEPDDLLRDPSQVGRAVRLDTPGMREILELQKVIIAYDDLKRSLENIPNEILSWLTENKIDWRLAGPLIGIPESILESAAPRKQSSKR